MDDSDSIECHALRLHDKQFEILSPVLALISCANIRAMELGGGFVWGEAGWQLRWPDEVAQGFGLLPSHSHQGIGQEQSFKVLFEPFASTGPNYWSTLFKQTAPSLVISYEANLDEPPIISTKDAEWLYWPWQVGDDEKISVLEKAVAAHEHLADQVDWLRLAEQSATAGPKSALFDAVALHVAERTGVTDTI